MPGARSAGGMGATSLHRGSGGAGARCGPWMPRPSATVGIRTAQPNNRLRQIVRNIFIAVRAWREKVSECFDSPPMRLL